MTPIYWDKLGRKGESRVFNFFHITYWTACPPKEVHTKHSTSIQIEVECFADCTELE